MARPKKYMYTATDMSEAVLRSAERAADISRRFDIYKMNTDDMIARHEKKIEAQEKIIQHWQTRVKKWRTIFMDAMTLEDAVTVEGQNVPFDVASTTHR